MTNPSNHLHRSFFPLHSLLSILICLVPEISPAQNIKTPTSETLDRSFWSLCVQDAETGNTLVDIRAHHLATPASTTKIYTTGTAMSMLPPGERIPTYLIAGGAIDGGVLRGNLYIVGHGDPSLGSLFLQESKRMAFFRESIASLKKKGIRRIEGDVVAVIPESDFQSTNPRWLLYDSGNAYGAGAHSLNIFDNSYRIIFSDYGRHFRTDPQIDFLDLTGHYTITSETFSDSLYVSYPEDMRRQVITGTYPARASSHIIRAALPDPPLFFAQYLHKELTTGGIEISGAGKKLPAAEATLRTDTLYTYLSPTIAELCKLTNVYSLNHYAEALMRRIGRDATPLPGHSATQTALMAARRYWAARGMDTEEQEFVDGSGLSPENKVSAHFLATLLGKIYRSDQRTDFYNTLPRIGRDGTLSYFLNGTKLEGKGRMKSGSIRNVVCYAGYITLSDKTYTVSIMVNNYYGKSSTLRRAMEQALLSTFDLE